VDDDEVGEMDDSSDDLYDHNIEYDANETFSEGSDDSDIEEIFPSINGGFKTNGKGQKDRYQSVSEDEDELAQSSKSMEEGEEEETRYNIKQPKAKTGPMEMTSAESDPDPDPDEDDEEGEEGEISAIFEPTIKKKSDGLTKQERKEKNAAKKAFWDAKGVAEEEDDSEAEQGVEVNMAE
jgi:hypothetical protein